MKHIVGLAILVVASALAACSTEPPPPVPVEEPAPEPARHVVGDAYELDGVWYYPREDYGYDETGVASWYDPGSGHRTANGEVFDPVELTAAHRTLPMPSLVRVTNLENGRAIVVRVNDRGPASAGRVVALSPRAAELLEFKDAGAARVRVEILAEESRSIALTFRNSGRAEGVEEGPTPEAAPSADVQSEALPPPGQTAAPPSQAMQAIAKPEGPALASDTEMIDTVPGRIVEGRFLPAAHIWIGYPRRADLYVQAGSHTTVANAYRLQARLARAGRAEILPVRIERDTYYRVRVGPFTTIAEADAALAKVSRDGVAAARIVVE